jgi:antibiotic biosynthesis monooxygenase (ABM) superfamily enzyme
MNNLAHNNVATFLGVFPVAMPLSRPLRPLIAPWNFLLNNAVFDASMVALLTWVVLPAITRCCTVGYTPTKGKHEFHS